MKRRQFFKILAQGPLFGLFAYFSVYMQPTQAAISLFMFLGARYYSRIVRPFMREFEEYYVERLEVNDEFTKARLTWASN